MPLPTERTVTGTYTNPVTGDPYDGTSGDAFIILDPVPDVWTDQGGNQILVGGGQYSLDAAGSFSEALVTTDAADVLPEEGKLWRLRAHMDGEWLPTTYFELPEGDGTDIDITDLLSVTISGITYVPVPGPEGPQGETGDQGDEGDSAYEVAVTNGFVGTEAAWLDSLVGPEGPEGPEGPQGEPGEVTEAELATALLDYAQLTGATFTGLVVLHGTNFIVQSGDVSKAYRFRQDGASLDLEGGGADLFVSVFENGDFTGDQFQYLRLESGSQTAHATGLWIFSDGPFGGAVHTLDGFANQVGFHGAAAQDQANITGERSTGEALNNLLIALGLRGDIVDATTAGPTVANDADVVKLTGNQTVGGVKTFSLSPTGPIPTTDSQMAVKSYVDDGDTANADDITTLDGEVVKLTGDQTIAGVKTFDAIPVGPDLNPTLNEHLTRKSYVDFWTGSNASDIDTLQTDVSAIDGFVGDLLGRVTNIEQGDAFLVGGNYTAPVLFHDTGIEIRDAGANPLHRLDGSTNEIGFHGATPVTQQDVTGFLSDGTALASLLTALDLRGDITDSSTAGPTSIHNTWTPEDVGLAAWTGDPADCQSSGRYESADRIRAATISIHKTQPVTDIVWYMLGYDGGLTTGSWAAIYDSAGDKVGTVADLTAVGSEPPEVHDAGGAMSGAPLDEGVVNLTPGIYTVVWRFIYNYGAPDGPKLLDYENSFGAPPNILARNGVIRFGYSTAAVTTPPASVPTLTTDGGNRFWVGLADDS